MVTLLPKKEALLANAKDAEWAPEHILVLWPKEESLAPGGNRSPIHRSLAGIKMAKRGTRWEGVNLMDVVRHRFGCRAFVNTVMNPKLL